MAKFKVLETIQSYMAPMGIYPRNMIDSNVNVYKSIEYPVIMGFLVVNTIICGAFICKNPSEMDAILNTLIVIFASLQSIGVYFSIGNSFNKVRDLHAKLQDMVDKGTFYFLSFVSLENYQLLKKKIHH